LSGTPVHSEQLSRPWLFSTVVPGDAAEFAAAVARALDEVGAGDGGQALEVIERELHGLRDEAVDEQRMLGRVDLRDTRVVPFKVQGRGGDDAVQLLQGVVLDPTPMLPARSVAVRRMFVSAAARSP
jgi:hypothetical protein